MSDDQIAETARSLQGFYRLLEAFERITGQSAYDLPVGVTRETSVEVASEFEAFRDRFLDAMDDDFNTGGAVGVLFELRTAINAFISDRGLDDGGGATDQDGIAGLTSAVTLLRELGGLLGVFRQPPVEAAGDGGDSLVDELMQLLIDLRTEARSEKNFELSDAIRDRLADLGITIEDRNEQTSWRRE